MFQSLLRPRKDCSWLGHLIFPSTSQHVSGLSNGSVTAWSPTSVGVKLGEDLLPQQELTMLLEARADLNQLTAKGALLGSSWPKGVVLTPLWAHGQKFDYIHVNLGMFIATLQHQEGMNEDGQSKDSQQW